MESTDPYFHPWVGSRYEAGLSGVKVLILGESHYLWDGYGARDESKNVVRLTIDEGPDNRFWQQVTTGFVGHKPTREEREDLFGSLAFYDFVQEPMKTHKDRPRAKQWRAAAAPFLQVIGELRPDLIAVFGKTVWRHLPRAGSVGKTVSADGGRADTYLIPTGDGLSSLAVSFKHPSAGFGGYKHHTLVQAALKFASR